MYVGKNRSDYLIQVESEAVVRSIQPNFGLLATIPSRGMIVTRMAQTYGYDFVSRFFAPALGIDEDPVTGSAHCCLAPFWKRHMHKQELVTYQASERGGVVRVQVEKDRVKLGGQVITIWSGDLIL
jgi:predicted PhzF superfamily epimerase YddE/YHI9